MVPVASRGVSRAPRYSGTRVEVRSAFAEVAITPYGRLFQVVWLAAGLVTSRFYTDARPTTPGAPLEFQIANLRFEKSEIADVGFEIKPPVSDLKFQISDLKSGWNAWFGLFRFRSPLLTESLLLSFPPGTEMVHFPGFARARLYIQRAVPRFYQGGFPHSEIPGSKSASLSPRLIAGSHVLRRRLAPRHPPYALSSLTIKSAQHTASSPRPSAFSPWPKLFRSLCRVLTCRRRSAIRSAVQIRLASLPGYPPGRLSTCRRHTIQLSKNLKCRRRPQPPSASSSLQVVVRFY